MLSNQIEALRRADSRARFAEACPPGTPILHGWLYDSSILRAHLTQLANNHHQRPLVVLELGAWLGKSTLSMHDILQEVSPDSVIFSVDLWDNTHSRSDVHYQRDATNRRVLEEDLFMQYTRNVWNARWTPDNPRGVVPMKMSSQEALYILHARGIFPDLIYIDADHHYEGVHGDIDACLQLFPHSAIVGDDWDYPDVFRAAAEDTPHWPEDRPRMLDPRAFLQRFGLHMVEYVDGCGVSRDNLLRMASIKAAQYIVRKNPPRRTRVTPERLFRQWQMHVAYERGIYVTSNKCWTYITPSQSALHAAETAIGMTDQLFDELASYIRANDADNVQRRLTETPITVRSIRSHWRRIGKQEETLLVHAVLQGAEPHILDFLLSAPLSSGSSESSESSGSSGNGEYDPFMLSVGAICASNYNTALQQMIYCASTMRTSSHQRVIPALAHVLRWLEDTGCDHWIQHHRYQHTNKHDETAHLLLEQLWTKLPPRLQDTLDPRRHSAACGAVPRHDSTPNDARALKAEPAPEPVTVPAENNVDRRTRDANHVRRKRAYHKGKGSAKGRKRARRPEGKNAILRRTQS